MPELVPQYGQSLDFLKKWSPSGPWVLTAIPLSKKGITAKFFRPGDESKVLEWLAHHGAEKNIYFQVNSVLREFAQKAEKHDISTMDWLHVDIDPRPGEDIFAERERALRVLSEYSPRPTAVVFSGGGYQGFWRLKEPIQIGGQEAGWQEAELYNRQLQIDLEGDPTCHNVDRIMRLPGTLNRPDERKRKKGRTTDLSRLEWFEDSTYSLSQFKRAVIKQGATAGFGGNTVKVSGNVQRFASVDDLPEGVSQKARVVIVQGKDPDEPNKFAGSRSEWLFYACCEMVRAGMTDDQIFSVITDPEYLISASVLDKGSGIERYAVRQIERAREDAENPVLRRLNEEYAVVGDINGRCRVIWEHEVRIGSLSRQKISFKTFEDFTNFHLNERVNLTAPNGQAVSIPVGKWWLSHPKRRTYRNMVFSPDREVPGAYNLWKGFAYDSRPGDCSLYLQLVREVICAGDEKIYQYVMGWCAQMVQQPAQPGHTAIVLRGRMGTGKGTFATVLGALLGRHFVHVSQPNHIVGNFNLHLRDCLLLFADEALFAGDKRHEAVLKALVTEDTVMIEKKGSDVDSSSNFVHIVMASNERWVVPAGLDERRFVVLDVSEDRIQDLEFFGSVKRQMQAGGYEALLHTLLAWDLSAFEPRKMPKTKALQEQKIFSLSAEEEWWYRKLVEGEVISGKGWTDRAFSSELCWDYTSYTKQWSTFGRSNGTRLGRFLNTVFPKGFEYRGQLSGKHTVRGEDGNFREVERPRVCVLPPLEVCRAVWDERFGGPYDWPKVRAIQDDTKSEDHLLA